LASLSKIARKISAGALPQWSSSMPGAAKTFPLQSEKIHDDEVVYFSACINQIMGCSKHDKDKRSLPVAVLSLLEKAQYHVRLCSEQSSLCCGMPMESKGFASQADTMAEEVNAVLRERSDNGRIPILCDTSPCTLQLRQHIDDALTIYEPVEFIDRFILDRVQIDKNDEKILLHVTCSSHKMSLSSAFERVARACSDNVTIPKGIACCGFAGDRGFSVPELNASALETLSKQIPEGVRQAYSNSRTCEIGLSAHASIPYQSLVYLVDRCAQKRGRKS
jgi:D-lactate dehydrogenase